MLRSRGATLLGTSAFYLSLAAPGAIPSAQAFEIEEAGLTVQITPTATTDYVFRGISQTDEKPALQANLDYGFQYSENFSSYFGVFGSSVDFNDGDQATIEIDLYAGLKPKFAGFEFDVGVIAYLYPGASDRLNYDYYEGKLGASYDLGFAVLSASGFYSPSYFGHSGESVYLMGGVDVPLPFGITLEGHFARQWIEKNFKFGVPDYYDWHVGARITYEGFTLAVRYFDTDLKKSECPLGICDDRVVVSIGKTF